MKFPQYLWTIRNRNGWLELRRGNDINEPIKKYLRKDYAWREPAYRKATGQDVSPVGVTEFNNIDAAKLYSRNHPWDWRNE